MFIYRKRGLTSYDKNLLIVELFIQRTQLAFKRSQRHFVWSILLGDFILFLLLLIFHYGVAKLPTLGQVRDLAFAFANQTFGCPWI